MFQRPPQQRKTLNSLSSNSAYVNHQYQQQQHQQQPPGSPMDIGYGAASQNQPSNHSPNYNRRPKANSSRGGGVPCMFFLLWTALLVGGGYVYFNFFLLPELVTDVTKDEVEHTKHHWMTKYHSLQLVHEALEKSHAELKASMADGAGAGAADAIALRRQVEETNQLLEQERTWSTEWKQKALNVEESESLIRRSIQEYSRRNLIQKYGYRDLAVEVEFDFGTGESAWVTIEMAPIDEMPHTIFTFFEQVSMGLYDDGGYAFHHNGNHIIMGSPELNHLTPPNMDPMQRFTDSGVANVLFQEYSDNFPHEPYTVGFAGRPGGPSFYFNTEDNSGLHGPNGYAPDGSADPCFGRVTRGQDIIDQIHGLTGELEHADWKQINTPVAVRWIKILN